MSKITLMICLVFVSGSTPDISFAQLHKAIAKLRPGAAIRIHLLSSQEIEGRFVEMNREQLVLVANDKEDAVRTGQIGRLMVRANSIGRGR